MTANRPTHRHSARGFSLVELMISMTIGLLLLTALATIFANSSRGQREAALSAQQIENGRYAIDLVSEDVRHAGYWGYYGATDNPPGAMPDPCALDAGSLITAMPMYVQGYNAPVGTLPSCLPAANYLAGTDILVVRHAATVVAGALAPNGMYMQSTPVAQLVGTPATTFGLTVRDGTGASIAAPLRAYETHIYFVSPCSVPAGATCTASDDGGKPIPTLKRLELAVDPNDGVLKMITIPLVEGIENFQVDYGIDSDGDGAPDGGAYVADPGAIANWTRVVAVQVYVLARNTDKSTDYTDSKTYSLGTAGTITPSASALQYRRHVYASLMRVKNPSERLETP
ncbi:MAG: PilW family protein [Burkholderiales bacterium]